MFTVLASVVWAGQYGFWTAPHLLPALPWYCHTLPRLLQTGKDRASSCSPAPALLYSCTKSCMDKKGGLPACRRTWWMCLGLWLSAPQSRHLDSYICQTVTVLSTLELVVNKYDERQQLFRVWFNQTIISRWINSNLYAEISQHILALTSVSNLWVTEGQMQLFIYLDTTALVSTPSISDMASLMIVLIYCFFR